MTKEQILNKIANEEYKQNYNQLKSSSREIVLSIAIDRILEEKEDN